MKKRFLSLIVLTAIALTALFGCSSKNTGSNAPTDYAATVTLDLTSTETKKLIADTTAYTHIDGDTTHFRQLDRTNDTDELPESVQRLKVFKARYLAVNTPESTGEIEPWGKLASHFTKTKLASAESIVLESNGPEWETDSNGRFLTWIWYKPEGATQYRNLNVELLQEGLAFGSNIDEDLLYYQAASNANAYAQEQSLYLYSKDADPDYYTGEAIETDLKTIRTHLEYFSGKRVAVTATVTVVAGKGSIYIEDLDQVDEETGLYYGMPVFYGMNNLSWSKILAPGNTVFLAGEVSYSESYGYQICNLRYNPLRNDPENIRVVAENVAPGYKVTDLSDFLGKITIDQKVYDAETDTFLKDPEDDELYLTEKKEYDYAELVVGTSIAMESLKIVDVYTTSNGGDNDGAMSITCQDASGKEIVVRTAVLYGEDGYKITQDRFPVGSYLTAKGIVDYYNNEGKNFPYQIKVFHVDDLTVESK